MRLFSFLKKKKTEEKEQELPEQLPVDPSKDKVVEGAGSTSYEHTEGHVDFKKTKSITRSVKRAQLKESFKKRKESFYDGDQLYGD